METNLVYMLFFATALTLYMDMSL